MGVPSITQRKHYRLVPGAPEERTSTIVLTSKDSYFVDVRLFLNKLNEEKAEETNTEACIDWAFAGKSHSTKPKEPREDDKVTHQVWDHWIDSKSNNPGVDEGDMSVQEDGDVLERGKSKDPVTGQEIEYEELWHDLGVVPLGKKQNRSSLVLRAEDPERNLKGMAVKVGGWCQAIVKVDDGLTIERWERRPAASDQNESSGTEGMHKKRTDNDWVRTFRVGKEMLPCEYMCSNTRGKIGLNSVLKGWSRPSHPHLIGIFRSYPADDDQHSETGWRVLEEHYW